MSPGWLGCSSGESRCSREHSQDSLTRKHKQQSKPKETVTHRGIGSFHGCWRHCPNRGSCSNRWWPLMPTCVRPFWVKQSRENHEEHWVPSLRWQRRVKTPQYCPPSSTPNGKRSSREKSSPPGSVLPSVSWCPLNKGELQVFICCAKCCVCTSLVSTNTQHGNSSPADDFLLAFHQMWYKSSGWEETGFTQVALYPHVSETNKS